MLVVRVWKPFESTGEIGLGSRAVKELRLATLTPGSSMILRTRSITDAVVSPGRILKLTTARALGGSALLLNPPLTIVSAVVV